MVAAPTEQNIPLRSRFRPWMRWIPVALVLVVLGVAIALIATSHWRRGATAIGIALAIAAVARLVLPDRMIGVLAVRSRRFDVIFCLVIMILLALLVIGIGPEAGQY